MTNIHGLYRHKYVYAIALSDVMLLEISPYNDIVELKNTPLSLYVRTYYDTVIDG